MNLSFEFFLRLIGAAILAFLLGFLGQQLALALALPVPFVVIILALLGALIGLILTPYVTTRPVRWLRRSIVSAPPERLVAVVTGMFLGLFASFLLSPVLSLLPTPFKQVGTVVAVFVFCYSAIAILSLRQADIRNLIQRAPSLLPGGERSRGAFGDGEVVLLDTSVIIDGRIVDVSRTGFLRSTLMVPGFILLELQHVADSADAIRRNRGRRGLEVLNDLQKDSLAPVTISDIDVSEAREADSKLVALARHLHCPIMTNDYNLNRVAELQGVAVLNINDLANAVKVIHLPGEAMNIKIIQEGKEIGQGVGYLDDGTMVVIEDGRDFIHSTTEVTVTKVLQTSAGRMIFARINPKN